jgi:hypothetical protein
VRVVKRGAPPGPVIDVHDAHGFVDVG